MHHSKLVAITLAFSIPSYVVAVEAPAVFGQILGTIINGAGQQPQQQQQQPASQGRTSQQSSQPSTKSSQRAVAQPPLKNAYNSKSAVQKIQIQTYLKQEGHYN